MIVLDTSFLIDYFRGVEKTLFLVDDKDIFVTVITYHEIMTGVKRKRGEKRRDSLEGFSRMYQS